MISKQKRRIDKKQPFYIEDGQLAIGQLGISPNENQEQDKKWLILILGKYLRCGSWTRANEHCNATSIGQLDIISKEDYQEILQSEEKDQNGTLKPVKIHESFRGMPSQINENQQQKKQRQIKKKQKKNILKRCRCCGLLVSQRIKDLSTNIGLIQSLGVCNHLYFQTILLIGFILLVTVLILCLYSLVTNIVASAIYRNYFGDSQLANSDNTFKGILITSYGSKRNMDGSYSHVTIVIQCWLTLITVIIMGYLLYRLKFRQIYYERIFNKNCMSPGKFSLFLANVPINLYGKDKSYFQSVFSEYVQGIRNVMSKDEHLKSFFQSTFDLLDRQIQVSNVTHIMPTLLKAYYSEKEIASQKMEEEKKQIRQKFLYIINQRKKRNVFKQSAEILAQVSAQADDFLIRQINDRNKLIDDIKMADTQEERSRFKTLSVIVTFNNLKNKQFIQALHERQKSLMYQLFYRHLTDRHFLTLPDEHGNQVEVKVLPAPEPQDIIWENHTVTHPYRILMIILMHLSTGVLLTISFIVVFFLSGQSQIISHSYEYKHSFWIISLVINLFLQAFDLLIGFSIKTFTKWERNCSQTDVHTSIATKTIMAVLVNSTLIPACIYGVIKRNVFGVEGLADTIFLQSLIKVATAMFMPVVQYIVYLLKICWKRFTYNLLQVKQAQLNKDFEKPEFQIGKNYAQLIGLYYFGCFYCNLQPLVAIIVGLGILTLYYSKQIAIYRFQKRPIQGSSYISHAMDNFIYLGPIIFAVGNFIWTDGFSLHTILITRISNVLTIIASLIVFFAPFQQFEDIRGLKKDRLSDQLKYEEQRIFFASQYARKNPLTENQAIQQHQQFLRNYFKHFQENYNSPKRLMNMSMQAKVNQIQNKQQQLLQQSHDQFKRQKKFRYTDEEYIRDGVKQPCIVVDINNSSPNTLISGFDFLNQLETDLNGWSKFKDIPVYANVGDWESDISVSCVNLEYLNLKEKDLIQIDEIIEKNLHKQVNHTQKQIRPQQYVERQNNWELFCDHE